MLEKIRSTLSGNINALLRKRKLNPTSGDMNPQEKAMYENWQRVMRAQVSVGDLYKLINSEIDRLRDLRESEAKPENDEALRERLLMWKSLKAVMEKPEAEMIRLNEHIKHLLLIEDKK